MSITNTQLAQQITDLVAKWGLREDEMVNWLAGVVAGGPSADGKYPLTDLLGTTKYVTCPAQLEHEVNALVDSAFAYSSSASTSAANAAASAANAAASASAAATSKSNALTYKDASVAAAQDSQAARDKAKLWAEQFENAEVEPGKYSALHYAAKAAASEANAATSEDMAKAWAENPVDTAVVTGQYSALHHATKAAQSASQAASSAASASTSASAAASSATQAATVVAGAVQADGSVPMTGDLQVPSINGGPLAGFRNRIINGRMEIGQRGSSFTFGPSTIGMSLDMVRVNQQTEGTIVVSRVADGPTPDLVYSLSVDVTGADTSIDVNQYVTINTGVEGVNIHDLIDTTFTLSFYVKYTTTGKFYVSFRNKSLNASLAVPFVIDAPNVWQRKTITVEGGLPSTYTWDKGADVGLNVTFALACGSNHHTASTDWVAANAIARSDISNIMASTTNEIRITGLQLERGAVATPFCHRNYFDEFALCQRYYQVYPRLHIPMRTYGTYTMTFMYQRPMRATPTVTWTDDVNSASKITIVTDANSVVNGLQCSVYYANDKYIEVFTITGGPTNSSVGIIRNLVLSAEL